MVDPAEVLVVGGEFHLKGLDASAKHENQRFECLNLQIRNYVPTGRKWHTILDSLGTQTAVRPDDQDLAFGDPEEAEPAHLDTRVLHIHILDQV